MAAQSQRPGRGRGASAGRARLQQGRPRALRRAAARCDPRRNHADRGVHAVPGPPGCRTVAGRTCRPAGRR
ncbi:hypothetical protein COLO4_01643, partial [Corchorus olitorius]